MKKTKAIIFEITGSGGFCLTEESNEISDFFIPNNQHYSLNGVECFAAIIIGFFLFIIRLSIVSYYFSIISVGETLMFAIYKQKSDDYNILKRKDEEELEDKSNVDKEDETESDNSKNITNKT